MRKALPACDIDWTRLFCLPVGVPPLALSAAERVHYAVALGASATMPFSSHGRYFADPSAAEVRVAGAGYLLPRHGRPLVAAPRDKLTPAVMTSKVKLIGNLAYALTTPPPGDAAAVDAKLQDNIPIDTQSFSFAPLPMPRLALDTIEVFFAPSPDWLPATLTIDKAGILDVNGVPTVAVPTLALKTSKASLGELDRLLLRAPVSGRYRFEPYYLYQRTGPNALTVIGPSATGRLLIEQPPLSTVASLEMPKTPREARLLFRQRTFAFDHVSRADVAELVHAQLAFQLCHLEALDAAHKGVDGAVPELAIPPSSPEVMGWVGAGVSHMLRAWTAFLSFMRWRQEDVNAAPSVKAEWAVTLNKDEPKVGDVAALIPIANAVLSSASMLESLLFFSANVYSRRLAGYSWTEVLALNRQNSARFPVPSDQPPFTANDDAAKVLKEQHQRLRLIEDPHQRWIACWAGAPIGRPAPVYAPAAAGPAFPANGITTYELEVLHAAGLAAGPFGVVDPPAVSKPVAGRVADLAGYAANKVGHACWFTAGPIAANPLHTTVDWLIEMTQGIHFLEEEEGFIDLMSLVDDTDVGLAGNPLAQAIRIDHELRAIELRRQMTDLSAQVVAGHPFEQTSIEWWRDRLGMGVGIPAAPTTPLRAGATRRAVNIFPGVLGFDDLMAKTPANPTGHGLPSGLSTFDLSSALLAAERMGLPLPVLLALMETEGVNLFAPINRLVVHPSPKEDQAQTTAWEACSRDPAHVLRPPIDDPEAGVAAADLPMLRHTAGRVFWLSFPYGLDRFALVDAATVRARVAQFVGAGVVALDAEEDVEAYIRGRVFSQFDTVVGLVPPKGVFRIWKLSRRVHWAILSLMAGFFRQLDVAARGRSGNFAGLPAACMPAGSSPPALVVGGVRSTPTSTEWKDYLTYYGTVYFSYNSSPAGLINFANAANAARGPSPLSLRDFMLFKHSRGNEVIQNVARFVIALDAFLRLDTMDGLAPSAFAGANADATDPTPRTGATGWGV